MALGKLQLTGSHASNSGRNCIAISIIAENAVPGN